MRSSRVGGVVGASAMLSLLTLALVVGGPAVGIVNGQAASVVVGQLDFTHNNINHGTSTSNNSLSSPTAVAFDSYGNMWVVDSGNNRLLEFRFPATAGENAMTELGQQGALFNTSAALVADDNLFTPYSITFDKSGNLWEAESRDNRILEFSPRSANSFANGSVASLEIGQRAGTNDFTTLAAGTNASALNFPTYITFDRAGDLWVSDSSNNRVLEFVPGAPPCPVNEFCDGMTASVELGQPAATAFTSSQAGILQNRLDFPEGLAFDQQGNLWVSDSSNNRILEFPPGSGGVFTPQQNGESAEAVIGQPDFSQGKVNRGGSVESNTLYSPFGIAFDPSGNLWVADYLNNRVLEFPSLSGVISSNGTQVIGQTQFTLSDVNGQYATPGASTLHGPSDVAFDQTGNMWVVDSLNNRVLGYLCGPVCVATSTATTTVTKAFSTTATYSTNLTSTATSTSITTLTKSSTVNTTHTFTSTVTSTSTSNTTSVMSITTTTTSTTTSTIPFTSTSVKTTTRTIPVSSTTTVTKTETSSVNATTASGGSGGYLPDLDFAFGVVFGAVVVGIVAVLLRPRRGVTRVQQRNNAETHSS